MNWMTWFATHGPLLMVVSHVSQPPMSSSLTFCLIHPSRCSFPMTSPPLWEGYCIPSDGLPHWIKNIILPLFNGCLCKTRFLVLVMPSMAATNLSAAWHVWFCDSPCRLTPVPRPGPWKSMSAWIFCILKPRKATLVETDSKPVTPKVRSSSVHAGSAMLTPRKR